MSGQTKTYGQYSYSEAKKDVVFFDGSSAGLRRQTVDVFKFLASNHDNLVTRDEIHAAVWKNQSVTDDSLGQCISEIRKAIGDKERKILTTIPKRGYSLIADKVEAASAKEAKTETPGKNSSSYKKPAKLAIGIVTILLITASTFFNYSKDLPDASGKHNLNTAIADGIPEVSISYSNQIQTDKFLTEITAELRTALFRYKTLRLVDHDNADTRLTIEQIGTATDKRLNVELTHLANNELVFAETYPIFSNNKDVTDSAALARRIASAIASPGVGALDRRLLAGSRSIAADKLTKAQCYAHGYGCSKCSGEEDNITRKAEACLANLLQKDANDSRAWALQATIHAHQYWWGNTLPEPTRSDPSLRKHLPQKAIDAANRAEALSSGGDTAVYWGMAEAYYSACEADKLHTAINRGLEINPDDPNLMASFGNWLSYSGKWDEGAALTRRALDLEPLHYRKWWWMGPAKTHYFKEEFEAAYDNFLKAFNERNWMSHLQLAYTLPHLGRIEEAKLSAQSLQRIYPGFTIEKALEIYQLLCFPNSFLANVKAALIQAQLPSRGNSDDLAVLTLPRAKVLKLNGTNIEYLDVGHGDPILFVHGAFNDYRTWGHYLVPVSENHRYISYSRRYFGTQEWKDNGKNFSVDTFSNDLIALIEALDLKDVHLVSWSSGVRTAVAAGVKRPDLFKSMIHFEPVESNILNGVPHEELVNSLADEWESRWDPVWQGVSENDNEAAARAMYEVVFEKQHGDYQNERETIKEIVRQNARTLPINFSRWDDEIKMTCEYASQLRVPTLIAVGEKTHQYWQQMSQRWADCLPVSLHAEIKGANHYAPLDKVDAFTKAVLSFVDQHR